MNYGVVVRGDEKIIETQIGARSKQW